jgi:Acyl-CoA dehydrogenase, N-terminal domain
MNNAAQLALLLDRVIDGAEGRPDAGTSAAILDEAARFAERHLLPLATVSDNQGCRLVSGRVKTADGHRAAWREFAEAGWLGLMAPEAAGDQALPFALGVAVQELFDAAWPAFGMLVINARCATRLLERDSDARLRARLRRFYLGSGSGSRRIYGPTAPRGFLNWAQRSASPSRRRDLMSAASARRHARGRGTASGVSPARNAGFPTAITTSQNASVTSQLRGRKARRRERARAGHP